MVVNLNIAYFGSQKREVTCKKCNERFILSINVEELFEEEEIE